MATEAEIAKIAKTAQEKTKARGLKVGDLVAHPSMNVTYKIESIDGNIANVWISNEVAYAEGYFGEKRRQFLLTNFLTQTSHLKRRDR